MGAFQKEAAEAKAAAEAKVRAEADAKAAAERAAAEMARALAEAMQLEKDASRGLDRKKVVYDNGESEGYGSQVPPYWKNKTGTNFVATNEVVRDALQKFMVDSSCSLPGCAATRQTRVLSVKRVENEPLWQTYQSMKKILKKNCAAHKQGILSLSAETKCQPAWCCNAKKDKGGRDFLKYITPSCIHPITEGKYSEMNADINEFYLFHGTSPEMAMVICNNGFNPAASSDHCLYGIGSYFAINSCKSHQYSSRKGDPSNLVMLVCRVAMGSPHPTTGTHAGQRRPPMNSATPNLPFDSIFARRLIANSRQQQHNEYVVFDCRQVYPEYIVQYTVSQ